MIKKRIIWILLLLFQCTVIFSQNSNHSVGVVDKNGKPIEFASIVIQKPDSTFVVALVTDAKGEATINKKPPIRLIISSVGYKAKSIEVSQFPIGKIQLEEDSEMLAEVVVSAKKPIVEIKGGNLVYDVTSLQRKGIATNAFDLVKEVPGVVSFDGNALSLAGTSSSVTVIINGRKSMMSSAEVQNLLKSFPPNKVKEVEVAYIAPASWDVRGAAINVVLKESLLSSVSGQVSTRYVNQHANSISQHFSLNLDREKYSLDFIYTPAHQNSISKSNTYAIHKVGSETREISSEIKAKTQTPLKHYIYLGGNWRPADKHSLSLSYIGDFTPNRKSVLDATNSLIGSSHQDGKASNHMHAVQFSYSTPWNIKLSADYLRYDTENGLDIQIGNNAMYRHLQNQQIDKVKGAIDGSYNFKNNWLLSYGGNYTYVLNQNRNRVPAYNSESTSETREDRFLGYLGVQKTFNRKLMLNLSLSAEWYKINEFEDFSLLPNVTATYFPAPNHIFQLGYNSFYYYPNYWQRQDYRQEKDGYEVYEGNPNLKTSRIDMANLVYVLKSKYVFNISFFRATDGFLNQGFQSPDEFKRINRPSNFDLADNWEFTMQLPFNLWNRWNLTVVPKVFSERYKVTNWNNISYDRNSWSFVIFANNRVKVLDKPNLYFTTMGVYRPTDGIDGVMDKDGLWFVNAGLEMTALDNKLSIALNANDIFESMVPQYRARIANQHYDINSNFYQRSVMLSVTYRFRSYKQPKSTEIDTSRYGVNAY